MFWNATLASIATASLGLCQLPWSNPTTGGSPQGQGQPQGQNPLQPQMPVPNIVVPGFEPNRDPDNLSSKWVQGAPIFPPNLGGYGNYPPPPGWGQPPPAGGGALPLAVPTKPGWPSWVQTKDGPPLTYEADRVVLVRHADRVWVKPKAEDAYVPLYHWDTTRPLTTGDRVKVERVGEFQLLFYGGARAVTFGPTEIAVDVLTEQEARITVRSLTRLRIVASGKPLVVTLPDGSVLATYPPDPNPSPSGAPPSTAVAPSEVFLERDVATEDPTGRATLFNGGSRPVRWQSNAGEVVIQPAQRVTFLLAPSVNPLPDMLTEDGVRAEVVGPVRRWLALQAGVVSWSGARFALPKGASLQLDPMLGDPFGAQMQKSIPKDPK